VEVQSVWFSEFCGIVCDQGKIQAPFSNEIPCSTDPTSFHLSSQISRLDFCHGFYRSDLLIKILAVFIEVWLMSRNLNSANACHLVVQRLMLDRMLYAVSVARLHNAAMFACCGSSAWKWRSHCIRENLINALIWCQTMADQSHNVETIGTWKHHIMHNWRRTVFDM